LHLPPKAATAEDAENAERVFRVLLLISNVPASLLSVLCALGGRRLERAAAN
jgi:hypothetical protein